MADDEGRLVDSPESFGLGELAELVDLYEGEAQEFGLFGPARSADPARPGTAVRTGAGVSHLPGVSPIGLIKTFGTPFWDDR